LAKRTSTLVVDAKEATGRLVTDIRSRKSSEPVLETDEVAATEESYDEDKSAAL
jgi:hypothetical protein